MAESYAVIYFSAAEAFIIGIVIAAVLCLLIHWILELNKIKYKTKDRNNLIQYLRKIKSEVEATKKPNFETAIFALKVLNGFKYNDKELDEIIIEILTALAANKEYLRFVNEAISEHLISMI